MAQGETSMRKHKLLIAVIMFGLTWAGIVKAEDQPIEQQLVDAMNKVFGAHPGFRANHAKGIVVEGNFKGSAEAAGLSRAVLFNGSPIPATVRFSDTTGIPNIADGSSNANPHGMAIKFSSAGRQRCRHGDQLTQVLSGSHRRRLSRFAAGTGSKSARRPKANKIRAVRGEPSFRACGLCPGGYAG